MDLKRFKGILIDSSFIGILKDDKDFRGFFFIGTQQFKIGQIKFYKIVLRVTTLNVMYTKN